MTSKRTIPLRSSRSINLVEDKGVITLYLLNVYREMCHAEEMYVTWILKSYVSGIEVSMRTGIFGNAATNNKLTLIGCFEGIFGLP